MKRTRLETLRVVSPCLEGWDRMTGDDRTRHCQRCEKNVFDVSQLSRDEAERLLERTNGDVCVRLTRRPDGSIVTRVNEVNPPVVPIRLRRAGPVAVAAVGLMLGVSGAAYAQEPVENQPVADKPAVVALASKDEVTQTDGAFASVTGTVRRADGGATKAVVTLVDTATGQYFITTIPENGTFLFNNLPGGEYRLFVQGMDYHYFPAVRVRAVNSGQTWRADVVLNQEIAVTSGGPVIIYFGSPLQWMLGDDPSLYARVVSVTPVPGQETGPGSGQEVAYRVVLEVDKHLHGKTMPRRFEVQKTFDRRTPVPIAPGNIVFVHLFESPDNFLQQVLMPIDHPFGPEAHFYREFVRLTYSRTPSRKEVIDWLVNGAVDPGSRSTAAGEISNAIENWVRLEPPLPTPSKTNPFNISASGEDFLSAAQKNRLMQALAKTATLGEGDRPLVELVAHFKHPELVPFLVRYLRENAELPGEGNLIALETFAGQTGNERIKALFLLYTQVENLNRSDLYFTTPDTKDEKPLDEQTVALEARTRARTELAALIRAALWAYDHPEAQEAGNR